MSKPSPSRFRFLVSEFIEQVKGPFIELAGTVFAPLLADRVAELVAERFGEVPPLLTAKGAAKYLAVDVETVRRMARAGEIPVIRVGVGDRPRLRFDAGQLRQALSCPVDTTASEGIGGDVQNGGAAPDGAGKVNGKQLTSPEGS